MILGNFCIKESPHSEIGFRLLLFRIFRLNFTTDQTPVFYNQINIALLLSHVNGAIERNVHLFKRRKGERDNSQSSYRNWMVHGLRQRSMSPR